jgi:hypothetical protein
MNTATHQETWTSIKIGLHMDRAFTTFSVRALLSPAEAKAHALSKIDADWSNQHSDYLRNCIELGNFTVTTTNRN